MGGKGGGGDIMGGPTTQEGQKYYEMYPDVAESGMNPYYHYTVYGQNEGRVWGQPSGGGGFAFEMPEFNTGPTVDYAAEQAKQQAEADRKYAVSQIDSLYRQKFAAANQAVDKTDSTIAEEMGYAKTSGADYNYTPEQRKERINNTFASLWSEGDESKLQSLESQYGANGNRWTLDVVRGVAKKQDEENKEGAEAGGAVDPKAVFGKLNKGEEDPSNLLGGILGALGG